MASDSRKAPPSPLKSKSRPRLCTVVACFSLFVRQCGKSEGFWPGPKYRSPDGRIRQMT